jgi:hypothetical protein
MLSLGKLAGIALTLGLTAGCASSSSPGAPQSTAPHPVQPATAASGPAVAAPAPGAPAPPAQPPTAASSVALREEKDLGKIWLAPGFDFKGFDTLLITETRADVPRLNPDGAANLEWARGVLQAELAAAFQDRKLFTVVTSPPDVTPGSRVLRLDNTIVEYEKGGGGARVFAGIYGAGQPVIRVRGQATAADRPLFVYEARRSSESGWSRVFGGYRDDKAIQQEDIKDLAQDLADFVARTKGP